jgi:hypothetical protein
LVANAPVQIVLVPVPFDAGSPAWSRNVRRPPPAQLGDRRRFLPQPIPSPVKPDRELIERMRRIAQDHVARHRPLIEAVLAA